MATRVLAPVALALVAFAAVPTTAGATSIVDGSFEAAGSGVTDYCYHGLPNGSGPCGPSAWGTQGGVIRSGSGPWGGTTTPDGNYFGMLQGGQVESQTVIATYTGSLFLSWIDANRNNYGGLHSYTVTVNNAVLGTYTSAFGGFVPKSTGAFNVVAGNPYTIAFNGIADGDTTTFIDSVALSAVPEPATWAMMLLGFGMVGFGLRSRRKQAVRVTYA